MKLWKLYDEEARDEPLFAKEQLNRWYQSAGVHCEVTISTYLPPHLFFFFKKNLGDSVLKISNLIFRPIPYVGRFGGIIVVEGRKS
jgi:hypothetical protein